MKHLIILMISLIPLLSFSQTKSNLTERELIGTWLIKEIKVNGLVKTDFKPELQDAIILKDNHVQITTDKEFGYEQTGPWKLKDEKYFELTDLETKETQTLEIVTFENSILTVKIVNEDTIIEMILNKK
jgi:hypothetical protein